MAAGDRIFMAKESTSQEILSNTKKIIEDAKSKTEKIRNENQPPRQQSGNPCQISF